MYLGKENIYLYATRYNSTAIHTLSMRQLLNGWLPELPAILNCFLLVSQYHKHSYRGGGEPHWLAKAMSTLKTTKWHPLVLVTSTYHTKQLNPWTTHHPVVW